MRGATRASTPAGDLVLLADQDRARWDRAQIDEGLALVRAALRRGRPGPYALQAAIAAVHAEAARAADTDWRQIVELYGVLWTIAPLAGDRAQPRRRRRRGARRRRRACSSSRCSARRSTATTCFTPRAPICLRRLGRHAEAADAYRAALARAENEAERRFISKRL